jgi:hypothetical protein
VRVLFPGIVLAAVCCVSCTAETVSHSPRELGVIVLDDLAVRDGKVVIRVGSNGCTDKAALRAQVRQEKGLTARMPHYVVTFERVRADDCKAIMAEGVVLEYDLAEDLGIAAAGTLSVTNRVYAQSEEASTADAVLRRGLLAATVRAVELEIRACEEKLKTAEDGVGPADNVERFRKQLAELRGHLQAFTQMGPAGYPAPTAAAPAPEELLEQAAWGPVLPARRQVVRVRLEEECKEGTLLNVEGMTRSGPFYHVAGIAGEARARLKPGSRRDVTLYLVYKRDYVGRIPNHYVYIAEVK